MGIALTAVVVIVAAAIGVVIGHAIPAHGGGSHVAAQSPTSSRPAPGSGAPRNSAAIAAAVAPDLVDIYTSVQGQEEEAGTGIVIAADGLILTNNHVIDGSTSIVAVDVGNRRDYTATVVGYDEAGDIAVLRLVHATGLHTARLGPTVSVRRGLPVVALGNAGGAGGAPSVAPGSVTGLSTSISARDPGNDTSEQLTGLIQTNADVVPGDSGGSLVDTSGVVIGMDTAAAEDPRTAGNALGFAIPIATVMSVGSAITSGHGSDTVHVGPTAFIGVGYSRTGGSVVAEVFQGSAAEAAGVAIGSEITTVGSVPVRSLESVSRALVRYHPGDRITLGWRTRAGASRTAIVVLGSGPNA